MQTKIIHRTEYSYDEPVEYALQRLRLTPKSAPGQTVLSWETSVEGATVEANYEDHFANRVELLRPESGRSKITILAEGVVETSDRHGVYGPHQGYVPLWLFLRETPLTKTGKLVREIARKVTGEGELAKMHTLMALIAEHIAYMPGTTTVITTAEQALEKKSGVCQDHAHAFVSAARTIGVPARYVSGYLINGETDQTASHAWAEAHISDLGWVGFDAANAICPNENYVRLATGLDYADAAPISGLRHGSPDETMTVTISVETTGQSQTQSQS